jgi:hypothetical protein
MRWFSAAEQVSYQVIQRFRHVAEQSGAELRRLEGHAGHLLAQAAHLICPALLSSLALGFAFISSGIDHVWPSICWVQYPLACTSPSETTEATLLRIAAPVPLGSPTPLPQGYGAITIQCPGLQNQTPSPLLTHRPGTHTCVTWKKTPPWW